MQSAFVTLPAPVSSFTSARNAQCGTLRMRSARWTLVPHANTLEGAGVPARCENAGRLARWLAADWSNQAQALQDPQFWSHIHVVFRPLSWDLMGGAYAFYSESAYDYNIGAPYKSAVYRVVEVPASAAEEGAVQLELECYKVRKDLVSEYWMGAHDASIIKPLEVDHLERMEDACNTVYTWDPVKEIYNGQCRPGNGCVVRRAGRGAPAYVDSTLTLKQDKYTAWDLGRDPETHERLWGTPAGPFDFVRVKDLAHLVPQPEPEPAAA